MTDAKVYSGIAMHFNFWAIERTISGKSMTCVAYRASITNCTSSTIRA
jgi:hypothetical protein